MGNACFESESAKVPIRFFVCAAEHPPAQWQPGDIITVMLNTLRKAAPVITGLVCMALLVMWITGAHGHRHIGGLTHQHMASSQHESHGEAGHSHEPALSDGDHQEPDVSSVIHHDGHENIDLQGLRPPSGTQLPDTTLAGLLFCVFFVLAPPRRLRIGAIVDPPIERSVARSLRPPLRGPPLYSVV